MSLRTQLESRYKDMIFNEEDHTYIHKGNSLTPVSNVIENFYEEFDTLRHATRVAKRRRVPVEVVIKEWDDKRINSQNFGTTTHNFGEHYAEARFFHTSDPKLFIPSNGHEEAIIKFWDSLPKHYTVAALELRMYSEVFNYAGTCDVLLYNTITGKFVPADYKTNEDIFKNFKGNLMLHPFEYLLDMPYNHYQLQLTLYQMLLEEAGYEVENRIIIWLLPDGTFKLYETKDFKQLLNKYLDENR